MNDRVGSKIVALLLLLVSVSAPGHALADSRGAFEDALSHWDLRAAEDRIESLDVPAERAFARGVLAFYAGRYREAEKALSEAASLAAGSPLAPQVQGFLRLARNAAEIFDGAPSYETPVVSIRFSSEKDVLLGSFAHDALATALPRLAETLGVTLDGPLRVEFLEDPDQLAKVTDLPVAAVRTTGTVGVTKHGRIVMVTPRVMLRGYPWLDTLVHEAVHALLVRRTGNRAPVWLQEGLAKYFETRWRTDDPPALEPGAAHLLRRAVERDDVVSFDEMHPSLALLPTQERAALAYAQVQTMVALLIERRGSEGLSRLLDAVARGRDPKDALASAYGAPFDAFMASWRSHVLASTRNARPAEIARRRFRNPDSPPDADAELLGDAFSKLKGGPVRKHARLGQLLERRGHLRAAAMEYEAARRARGPSAADPMLARRLGHVLLELGRPADAAPLLRTALAATPDHASLAADLARAELAAGRPRRALRAAEIAIRTNPFIYPVHCVLAEVHPDPKRRERARRFCRKP